MKSNDINELAVALAKAQSEIKSAIKESPNQFKTKYADLHSTWEACRSALTKNNLSVVQTVAFQGDAKEWVLATTLIHTSNQWMRGFCPLINLKGDMQGLGSAITYARRYGLAAICGVATEDDDAEASKSPDDIKSPPKFPRGNSFINKNDDSQHSTNPSDYVIPLKKFQGKKLSEIKDFEILNYLDWIKREGLGSGPKYAEFIRHAEIHLKKGKDPSEPPPVQDDDLPWPETVR